jgi:hypothetical protein
VAGPYGPEKKERAVVATTDPQTLPDLTTWYLVTNLPAPTEGMGSEPPFPPASLEEVIRPYGLRTWVEQSYKHVKHALGWSQYQVRSDQSVRRHWQLVCCAFSFCWYHGSHPSSSTAGELQKSPELGVPPDPDIQAEATGAGEKISARKGRRPQVSWPMARRSVRDGWNPGSCCSAIGRRGQIGPHLRCSNAYLSSLGMDSNSSSTARTDWCSSPVCVPSQSP